MSETEAHPRPALVADHDSPPQLSVVATLYNERESLDELHRRAVAALEGLGRPFEIVYVDDGSTDGTFTELARLHATDARVKVTRFKRNFGQHPAMHAGLSRARGDIVITMDGDLQNLPEDIPKLVAAIDEGYDVASGRRAARNDSWGRTLPSRLISHSCWITNASTHTPWHWNSLRWFHRSRKAPAPHSAINWNAPPPRSRSISPKAALAGRSATAATSSRCRKAPRWNAPQPSTSFA